MPELGRSITTRAGLAEICSAIKPLPENAKSVAAGHWRNLCKPLYSLGLLEDLISQIAAIQGVKYPNLNPRAVFVFGADNGIVAEGVTQAGQEVTAQVMRNMLAGQSCVCYFAQACTCDVRVVNLGTRDSVAPACGEPGPADQSVQLIEAIVQPGGTADFSVEPAMSEVDLLRSVSIGFELAQRAAEEGYRLLIGGEMGIGNTTTSTAIICARFALSPREVTGRGAGLSDQGLARKVEVIERALANWRTELIDPLSCLRYLGGFDLAALTGFYLGAASSGVPVILDGLISLTAATLACDLSKNTRDYLIAAHRPRELAGQAALQKLDLKPLLDADLAIGEGAGGVSILPQLDMANTVFNHLASFDQGGVLPYRDYSPEKAARR